jgi:dTDP-glucose pyrophosphorylase
VDIHKQYLAEGVLDVRPITGAWFDTGTHEALLAASVYAKEQKLPEKFHPIINEAIQEFNAEFKKSVSLLSNFHSFSRCVENEDRKAFLYCS